MMAHPPDIVGKFRPYIFLKGIGKLVNCAGEHKILPDHKPQFIAEIQEIIFRIIAAAPYADGIKVSHNTAFQQLPGAFLPDPPENIILRDIIGAHGKDLLPVDFRGKAFSIGILFPPYGYGAQTDSFFPGIKKPVLRKQPYFHFIEIRTAQAVRPPQHRVVYPDLTG